MATCINSPKIIFAQHYENIVNGLVDETLKNDVLIKKLNKCYKFKLSTTQQNEITKDFLKANIPNLPTVICMGAILATFANRSQKTVNRGMFFDIQMLSSLLPYCDAIFIDKDIYKVLTTGPASKLIKNYQNKIFSLINQDEFLKYLKSIEDEASELHKEIVEAVYFHKTN